MSELAVHPQLPLWRRIVARVLVVLGLILAAVALLAGYLRWQAFDSDTFNETSSELIANDAVRDQVAATMVEQLFTNVDVAANLEARLPPDQQGLAQPLAGALRALADQASVRLLERPRAQALWREASALAHDRLVALLRNETTVVQVEDQAVVLNLQPMIVRLGEQIGLSGNFAERLPEDAGLIRLMDAEQLERAQDATSLFESVARWIWFVPLALFAVAIWLVRGRRRIELRAVAIGLVVVGLLVLVLRSLTGSYVVDELATTTSVEEAAAAAWSIMTDLLADGAWTAIAVGVIALVGVWLAGPTRSGSAARRWAAPVLARCGSHLRHRGGALPAPHLVGADGPDTAVVVHHRLRHPARRRHRGAPAARGPRTSGRRLDPAGRPFSSSQRGSVAGAGRRRTRRPRFAPLRRSRQMMNLLFALLALVAAVVVAIILFSTDHVLLGVVAALSAVPFALAAWIWRGDRY